MAGADRVEHRDGERAYLQRKGFADGEIGGTRRRRREKENDGPGEGFEIAFIIIPLLVPVAQKMGIDLIWFGVLIGVDMQTSFIMVILVILFPGMVSLSIQIFGRF
jgi:Tripartite ATP-independent periplasmic transporter, DctM component